METGYTKNSQRQQHRVETEKKTYVKFYNIMYQKVFSITFRMYGQVMQNKKSLVRLKTIA